MNESDFIKMREADKKRIRALYPQMEAAVQRAGNIIHIDDLVAKFGKASVDLALHEKQFQAQRIKYTPADGSSPPQYIDTVKNTLYSGERPAWLAK